jgi:GT2 family glycosyltransferase
VSVVVATTHDPSRLLRCVASIQRGAGAVPHEVVLVLSGADDDVVEAARGLLGVRLAASSWNLGFAGACNLGRTQARGELIVLLHDDAEAEAGWLPSLVDSAERHPDAGVIGSRVVRSDDGRLQLAGAVVFSDASTALLGRGAESDAPEHMVSRAVDYCSSCSLLVRAETWDAIGGADELLFPAATWTRTWAWRPGPPAGRSATSVGRGAPPLGRKHECRLQGLHAQPQ